jgi:hypothetical protein
VAIRIGGPGQAGGIQGGPTVRRGEGAGSGFRLPEEASTPRTSAATLAGATAIGDIASLLALQGMAVEDDPRERRRKAVRWGLDLLDVLEGVKIDLLGGGVPTDRLERIVRILGERRPSGDARLDALVEDVELRARVELAKFGRYPD